MHFKEKFVISGTKNKAIYYYIGSLDSMNWVKSYLEIGRVFDVDEPLVVFVPVGVDSGTLFHFFMSPGSQGIVDWGLSIFWNIHVLVQILSILVKDFDPDWFRLWKMFKIWPSPLSA